MSMPFYVAPEQMMKDRADFARKGIARGRALVAVRYNDGIVIVSNTDLKIGCMTTDNLKALDHKAKLTPDVMAAIEDVVQNKPEAPQRF